MGINGPKYKAVEDRLGSNLEEHLKQRFTDGYTCKEIADELGESTDTVWYWLKRHGLSRSGSEANRLAWQKGHFDREATKQRAYDSGFHKVKQDHPCPWKGKRLPDEWRSNISKGMKGLRVGSLHPLWRGGTSIKNYSFGWKAAKRVARQRAGFRCEVCGISEADLAPRRLDVHHIIPVKNFANIKDSNDPANLRVVCRKCHKQIEG